MTRAVLDASAAGASAPRPTGWRPGAWARTQLDPRRTRRSRSATAAGLVFVAACLVALPLCLVLGDDQWFFLDEWDFLADRRLGFDDLLRPHNEHWSTLPILVYRVLWRFVGLRSYVPYQLVVVVLHLTAAVLLRRIMRRAGVGPWIATAAASLFVFLGAGRENIVWAFQMGFVASLVCGFAHLILADHDGTPNRRDALGLAFGVAGLLCSGVTVTMTGVVGLAVLARRGWRAAALHTVPLAALYGLWYVGFGHDGYQQRSGTTLASMRRFVTTGLQNAFEQMGQTRAVAIALVALLVAGLALAWSGLPIERLRRRAAVPASLLVGTVVFLAIAAYGRSFVGSDAALASRYVHLVAAMTLPAIAVAADAFARRWRVATPLVVVVLLLGVPGNIDAIRARGTDRLKLGQRSLMLGLSRSAFAEQVPRSVRPNPQAAPEVTIGWLLDGAHAGRIPEPSALTPEQEAAMTLRLVLEQTQSRPATRDCTALAEAVPVSVGRGDVVVMGDGPAPAVQLVSPDGARSVPMRLEPAHGRILRVVGGPVSVVFTPDNGATGDLVLCRGA